jgi:hypothetical protein
VEQHIPIVPELAARLFLFVDQFVHLPRGASEWSEPLTEYLRHSWRSRTEFPRVLSAIMAMERSSEDGAGWGVAPEGVEPNPGIAVDSNQD